ncbi:MAG TPA: hypothetical protein P5160_08005 [Candidatus Omnitrophota bacterium]|nr:hypothetical protein [Candidatus Omnitrophota bacterium]
MLILANIFFAAFGWPYWPFSRFLGLGGESNFTTWVSSSMMLIAGIFAFLIGFRSSEDDKKETFFLIGTILFFMSCDETAMIHEYLGPTINQAFLRWPFPKTQWVIVLAPPAIAVFTALSLKCKPYFRSAAHSGRYLLAGLVTFCMGAFAVEMSIGFFDPTRNMMASAVEVCIEESLELIGAYLFLKGIMLFWNHESQTT